MTDLKDLRMSRTWTNTHKGLFYKIKQWGVGEGTYRPEGTWNYYVIICNQQVSEEDWKKLWLEANYFYERSNGVKEPCYDYWKMPVSDADWHGGVTFYQKHGQPESDYKSVEIGCDFSHLWDEGKQYDLTDVHRECLATIEKILTIIRVKQHCPMVGDYFYPEDGVPHPKSPGLLISKRGYEYCIKESR